MDYRPIGDDKEVQNLRVALAKLKIGDSVTDTELELLIINYAELEARTRIMGEEFKIFWRIVRWELDRLIGFRAKRQAGTGYRPQLNRTLARSADGSHSIELA